MVGSNVESHDWEWMKFQRETSGLESHDRVGVALIGMGRMGLIHLRNLLSEVHARLLYCFDTDIARLTDVSKRMHFMELNVRPLPSESFQVALDDPKVQSVIIATPTSSHEYYTRLSLEAGKNVLCEKPLTPRTDTIGPLYELAKRKGVFLLCAFNRRYDPDFRHLRNQIVENELGPLHLIKITSRDCQRPPLSYLKNSGGLFHDSAVHDIDMSLWLNRQLPETVQVIGKTWKEFFEQDSRHEGTETAQLTNGDCRLSQEIDDFFMVIITMKFPDSSVGIIDNSRQAGYGYDQRCEVFGSKGMLSLDGKKSLDTVQYSEKGISHSAMKYIFASRYSNAYKNELRDLIVMSNLTKNELQGDLIKARQSLLEPNRPSLVVATHTIADACLKASKIGQPVSLYWSEEFTKQFENDIN